MSSFAQNVDKALEIFWNDWMDLVLHNLTVAVVKLRRPPDHAVGLPVPDALDQLVLQVLLPGKGLAWTGVRDCVTKLPLLVRPGHIHSHQRGRDSQTTASCCKNRKVSSKMFNKYSRTHSGRVFGAHFLLRHSISKYGHFPLDHWKPFLQRYFVTSMPKTLSEPSPSGAGGGWSGQNISRGKLPVCYLLITSITRSSKDEKWPYTAHRAVVSSASSAKCIAYCTVQNST